MIFNEEAVEINNRIEKDTPRKRILAEMKEKLYRSDVYAGSMVARLKETLRTPYAQIEPPNAVTKKRGRPAGAKNKTSVTRDKSNFEYVEGRKCGQCGMSGHNALIK